MEKQILLSRISRLERLAQYAREDKYVDKCRQAYRLLAQNYEKLNKLMEVK